MLSRPSWTPVSRAKTVAKFAANSIGIEGAILQGVLIDEALRCCSRAQVTLRGRTGARAIHQARHALVGKAIDPIAEGENR